MEDTEKLIPVARLQQNRTKVIIFSDREIPTYGGEREINTCGQSLQQNGTKVIIFSGREIPTYGGEREVNTGGQSLQQNRTKVIIFSDREIPTYGREREKLIPVARAYNRIEPKL